MSRPTDSTSGMIFPATTRSAKYSPTCRGEELSRPRGFRYGSPEPAGQPLQPGAERYNGKTGDRKEPRIARMATDGKLRLPGSSGRQRLLSPVPPLSALHRPHTSTPYRFVVNTFFNTVSFSDNFADRYQYACYVEVATSQLFSHRLKNHQNTDKAGGTCMGLTPPSLSPLPVPPPRIPGGP